MCSVFCVRRLTFLIGLLLVGPISVPAQSDELLDRLQPQGYVSDYAGVFSANQRSSLNRLLLELEQKTTAQVSVVALRSLEGGEIRDFSNRLFEKWGIGQKGKDNGVLILTGIEDRRIWIEVGYGIEPIIPDARAGRILDEAVVPSFRRGDYASGLIGGAQSVASIIAQNSGVQLTGGVAVARPARRDRGLSIFHLIFLLIALIVLFKNPWLALFLLSGGRGGYHRGGFGGGGFGGGGSGGFGGGLSGGGGAGRSW